MVLMKDEEYLRLMKAQVYYLTNDHRGTQKPKSPSPIRFDKTVNTPTPKDLTFWQ